MQSLKKILENVTPQQICSALPVKPMTNNQKTMSSNSSVIHKADKCIDLLFSKFAAFYGHVWRSQFKDELFLKFAKKEWQEGLMKFSEETINKAVYVCREQSDMPPTLPHMIGLCRDYEKSIKNFKPDNGTPAARDIVDFYLAKCKEILKI
jgi:hypothetical protein